jgi:putative endonuclease
MLARANNMSEGPVPSIPIFNMTNCPEFPSGWCCYLLLCSDESYYCGATSNLVRRVRDHFSGKGSGYTKRFKPVELVWYESQPDRRRATAREKQIKSWSRDKKKRLADTGSKSSENAAVVSLN